MIAAALTLAMGGCAASGLFAPPEPTADDRAALTRLTRPPSPPVIFAADAAAAREASAALTPERLAELRDRAGAQSVRGAQTPLFFGAAFGRAFLDAPAGRALALGSPAEACASRGSASGDATAADAAGEALRICLGDRTEAEIDAGCGCRVMAVDDVILTGQDGLAYARAVSATLYRLDRGGEAVAAARYIAEGPDPGDGALNLFGPEAAVLTVGADGAARLDVAGIGALSGQFERIGRRRGRVAGVAALTGAQGARYVLLHGVEPAERRAAGAALIARARTLF